ncbi:MAG: hypothetical protein AB7P69_29440 [Candidatus Binatia bacterium]
MDPPTPLSRQQTDQLLRWLKDFRALGGVVAINDLQRYLHQCLRAQALNDLGFKARVRGQWRHWLVVVEGGRHPASRLPARTTSSSRRFCMVRSHSAFRPGLKNKPSSQRNTTESPPPLHPWFLD